MIISGREFLALPEFLGESSPAVAQGSDMKYLMAALVAVFSVLLAVLPGVCRAATTIRYFFMDVGSLGGSYSSACAINEQGQVAGYSSVTGNYGAHGVRTAPNQPINPATDDTRALPVVTIFPEEKVSCSALQDFCRVLCRVLR